MEKISLKKQEIPCTMTVAGSDSGGGARIQADILTIAAHNVYACSAIAAITAQNPNAVSMISTISADMLESQMLAIADFYKPTSAKTGMLFSADIVESVAKFFAKNRNIKLVVDPVMIATSGAKLLKDDAIEILKTNLLPLATLITPNLDEAALLLGKSKIVNLQDSAKAIVAKFGCNTLLKGGHLEGDDLSDILATLDGQIYTIKSKRVKDINTHGSGCTLSAAIAANIALGKDLQTSCSQAHAYLLAGMRNSVKVGGQKFINHFPLC